MVYGTSHSREGDAAAEAPDVDGAFHAFQGVTGVIVSAVAAGTTPGDAGAVVGPPAAGLAPILVPMLVVPMLVVSDAGSAETAIAASPGAVVGLAPAVTARVARSSALSVRGAPLAVDALLGRSLPAVAFPPVTLSWRPVSVSSRATRSGCAKQM